jgi:hypothetical protein
MRLDSALVHEPPNHLGRAVTRIGDQARRSDFELFGRAVEHHLGRADFGLANGRRRLDVHDHCMLQIDEIVVGIGITGDGVGRSGVGPASTLAFCVAKAVGQSQFHNFSEVVTPLTPAQ